MDGTEVKWYATCSEWTDHYRTEHPAENNDREVASVAEEEEVADVVADESSEDSDDGGTFSQLRRAGLM